MTFSLYINKALNRLTKKSLISETPQNYFRETGNIKFCNHDLHNIYIFNGEGFEKFCGTYIVLIMSLLNILNLRDS